MLQATSTLLTPTSYLRLKHPRKAVYDYLLPAVLTLGALALFGWLPGRVDVFGAKGLLANAMGLLQLLTGFYIAGLGVVATIDRKGMDERTDGTPIRLKGKAITRRQYLSFMFGYLALASLALYLAGMLAQAVSPGIRSAVVATAIGPLRLVFLALYGFAFCNVVVTTLYGLYYLSDKLHRELRPSPKPKAARSSSAP